MAAKRLSKEIAQATVNLWVEHNFSRTDAARAAGIPTGTFESRLEAAMTYGLIKTMNHYDAAVKTEQHSSRLNHTIKDGICMIGSDAHYWPGVMSPAHKAFIYMIKQLKPMTVIMNGDVLDGAGVSRHPSIGWENKPTLADEIEECKARLEDIELAAPKNARKIWTLGNHDARFESRIANVAPEYAKIHGVHLKDHFPKWEPCWSVWLNKDVVVKHRWKGGVHAAHNNTVGAGKTMITGHLHSLKVTPYNDYNGVRYGVDTGCLAPINPMGEAFIHYLEDGCVNWRAGFAVLTFVNGELLWPELVHVIDQKRFQFRGKIYYV